MASTCPHGVFLEMMATREKGEEAKNCPKKKCKIELAENIYITYIPTLLSCHGGSESDF